MFVLMFKGLHVLSSNTFSDFPLNTYTSEFYAGRFHIFQRVDENDQIKLDV